VLEFEVESVDYRLLKFAMEVLQVSLLPDFLAVLVYLLYGVAL